MLLFSVGLWYLESFHACTGRCPSSKICVMGPYKHLNSTLEVCKITARPHANWRRWLMINYECSFPGLTSIWIVDCFVIWSKGPKEHARNILAVKKKQCTIHHELHSASPAHQWSLPTQPGVYTKLSTMNDRYSCTEVVASPVSCTRHSVTTSTWLNSWVIYLELWDLELEIICDHLATCWPAGTIVGGVYSTANFENVKSGYHYLTAAKDEQ